MKRILFPILAILLLASCSKNTNEIPLRAREIPLNVTENPVPGTVNKLWKEPMYNQVQVPAQLDPNGIYYRPAHNTIVEIRKDKFQKVEFPEDQWMQQEMEPGGSR